MESQADQFQSTEIFKTQGSVRRRKTLTIRNGLSSGSPPSVFETLVFQLLTLFFLGLF